MRTELVFIIALFLSFLSLLFAQSEQPSVGATGSHYLSVILFESYLTPLPDADKVYDATDLPSTEFPIVFSRLFKTMAQPQEIQLPPGLNLPKDLLFVDIFTFNMSNMSEAEMLRGKRLRRENRIQRIDYRLAFQAWSEKQYALELDGQHEDFKFRSIRIEGVADRTKLVRIRRTASRTLYIALTRISFEDREKDVVRPVPIAQPLPNYPTELSRSGWSGKVALRGNINLAGRIDPDSVVVLECPHYLFARSSLDVVLNQWTYRPATRDGVPIEIETGIEVSFTRGFR